MAGRHHRLKGHKVEQIPGDVKPGVLRSVGSQRVRHHWATEQQRLPRVSPGALNTEPRAQKYGGGAGVKTGLA